jgi:hypothetical protein
MCRDSNSRKVPDTLYLLCNKNTYLKRIRKKYDKIKFSFGPRHGTIKVKKTSFFCCRLTWLPPPHHPPAS